MNDNIKELYSQVLEKNDFIKLVANEYGRSESSVRSNWLSTFSIPDHFKKRVHELLISTLKLQINKTKRMIKNESKRS